MIYNKEDRLASRQARRDAVVFLRSRLYSFKAIAYALGIGPERARQLFANESRKTYVLRYIKKSGGVR